MRRTKRRTIPMTYFINIFWSPWMYYIIICIIAFSMLIFQLMTSNFYCRWPFAFNKYFISKERTCSKRIIYTNQKSRDCWTKEPCCRYRHLIIWKWVPSLKVKPSKQNNLMENRKKDVCRTEMPLQKSNIKYNKYVQPFSSTASLMV